MVADALLVVAKLSALSWLSCFTSDKQTNKLMRSSVPAGFVRLLDCRHTRLIGAQLECSREQRASSMRLPAIE
jgi:hypothetical protein